MDLERLPKARLVAPTLWECLQCPIPRRLTYPSTHSFVPLKPFVAPIQRSSNFSKIVWETCCHHQKVARKRYRLEIMHLIIEASRFLDVRFWIQENLQRFQVSTQQRQRLFQECTDGRALGESLWRIVVENEVSS